MMPSLDGNDGATDAASIWKFLDQLSLTNPDEYKRYIDKVMKEGEELNFGPPVKKFAVETYKTPKIIPERKHFINIAEWKQVPKPESRESPVPVVASKPRKELIDKEWAMLIDVVLNPVVFTDCKNDLDKCAIVELVFKCIEDKNGFGLSRKYKFLDDKYKGNEDYLLNFMAPSSLQKSLNMANEGVSRESILEKMKHLQKVEDEKPSEKPNKTTKNVKNDNVSTPPSITPMEPIITANMNTPVLKEVNTKSIKTVKKKKLKTPKVEMEVNKEEGNVELIVYLTDVESVSECNLELTENHISLTAIDKYDLELDLSVNINVDESRAQFVKDLKELHITAEIIVPSKNTATG